VRSRKKSAIRRRLDSMESRSTNKAGVSISSILIAIKEELNLNLRLMEVVPFLQSRSCPGQRHSEIELKIARPTHRDRVTGCSNKCAAAGYKKATDHFWKPLLPRRCWSRDSGCYNKSVHDPQRLMFRATPNIPWRYRSSWHTKTSSQKSSEG